MLFLISFLLMFSNVKFLRLFFFSAASRILSVCIQYVWYWMSGGNGVVRVRFSEASVTGKPFILLYRAGAVSMTSIT